MSYTVNFEEASLQYSYTGKDDLKLMRRGKEPESIEVDSAMGYEREIGYFIDCVARDNSLRP